MTTNYKNILVAIELNPKSDRQLIENAKYMAAKTGAKITLVHAIEHIGAYSAASYGVISIDAEMEDILIKNATKSIEKIGKKLNIPKKNQIVDIGSAKFTILEEANRMKADLIIIGSHGREGIRKIIGSTTNAVMYGAKCDVLAVRMK